MMNSALMTMLRAAAKSSTRTKSALVSRPSLAYLARLFSAQMQMDDKSRGNEMLQHAKITPPSNNNNNNKDTKDELMAGYPEYLDQMMEKTSKIESSMQALRETSLAQKKQYATTGTTTIKWMDASEIDRLFDESVKHKQDISTELSQLKSILQEARQDFYHGVDAPDGESDWHVREEMQEINHIIDDAAVLEDKDEVVRRHKMEAEAARIFAVDAPDGESDGYVQEHLNEEMQLKSILQEAPHQDAQDFHGVDAPDGESDWHVREEIQEINHIIDDAAVLEDKDEVVRRHKLEAEAARIFAVDAPDGESDGYVKEHLKEEMQEIKNIIDYAAVVEDKDEVVQRHKIYAVDAPDGDSDGHVQEEKHEVQHIIDNANMLKDKTAINRKHKMY